MGTLRRSIAFAAVALVLMLPEAAATRYIVGEGRGGWTANVNYTDWVRGRHFYNGDWLYFVYDRNQQSVLEVNRSGYDNCTSDQFLHNWTTGAGREVVPLNVTRNYYFISGNGFCFSGMKIAIHVQNPPPPPSSSPIKSDGYRTRLMSGFRAQVFVPAIFAVGAAWDSLLMLL